MKFFRKMDEMEMHINLQALRFTYLFIIIFLAARLIYLIVSNNYDPSIAFKSWDFFLLVSQFIIYFSVQQVIKKRIDK